MKTNKMNKQSEPHSIIIFVSKAHPATIRNLNLGREDLVAHIPECPIAHHYASLHVSYIPLLLNSSHLLVVVAKLVIGYLATSTVILACNRSLADLRARIVSGGVVLYLTRTRRRSQLQALLPNLTLLSTRHFRRRDS